jgi:hypothetical protein
LSFITCSHTYRFGSVITMCDTGSEEDAAPKPFAITPDEDAEKSVWLWDNFSFNGNRLFRISVSQFTTDTHEGDNQHRSTWIVFKLFRMSTTEHVLRKYQEICYRHQELEVIIRGLENIRNDVSSSMSIKHEVLDFDVTKLPSFPNITDSEDLSRVHWFLDIYETPRRKTRVSSTILNLNNPFGSTHVQFKMFTRGNPIEVFTRTTEVNCTLEEFHRFCNSASEIQEQVKQNAS